MEIGEIQRIIEVRPEPLLVPEPAPVPAAPVPELVPA